MIGRDHRQAVSSSKPICAKLGQAEGGVEVSEQGVMQGDIRDPTGNACKVVQDFIIWIQKQSSLMKDVP